jgi:hypothetical protein
MPPGTGAGGAVDSVLRFSGSGKAPIVSDSYGDKMASVRGFFECNPSACRRQRPGNSLDVGLAEIPALEQEGFVANFGERV